MGVNWDIIKIMKIALVRPNSIIVSCPPPLGLGYLAGYLKKHRQDEIMLIDARRWRMRDKEVVGQVKEWGADLVGISVLSFEANEAVRLARLIKESMPGVILVLGGAYPSSIRERVLEEQTIDFGVVGEGEQSFLELISGLEQNRGLEGISGVSLRVNGEARFVGYREPIKEIDSLEVDWELIQPERYFSSRLRTSQSTLRRSRRMVSFLTSRGCPYGCYFCHNIFGRRFRARSVENVLKEIDYLVKRFQVEELEINDDTFNLNLERAKKILREIAKRNYKLWLSFPNGIRGDMVDEEFLDLLKSAGTYRVSYAVESANPARQQEMGKRLDLEKVRWAIEETYRRGMHTAGFFILGFPGESEEEMRRTLEFAFRSKLQTASFFHLKPFPGTLLGERYLKGEDRLERFYDYSTLDINLSSVSDERFREIRKSAYRRFYFSLFRIWSNFWLAPKNFRTLRSIYDAVLLSIKDSVNY